MAHGSSEGAGAKSGEQIAEWLAAAKARIDSLDAELIALRCFAPDGADRSWLVGHAEMRIGPLELQAANQLLTLREKGYPLAYVVGEKEFYGRVFQVSQDVLIPRPETEVLIDLVKELPLGKRPQILDMGTGSGCIAITLALEIPQAVVMASDVSTDALDMAASNDAILEGRVELIQSDLFEDIDPEADGPFDVIVANLPYVNPDWEWLELDNLKFEPPVALYSMEQNGLGLYARFFRQLAEFRRQTDVYYVVLEADPCQHQKLIELAGAAGWKLRTQRGYGLVFHPE